MKTIYYSEKLKKNFETAAECEKAEKAYDEKVKSQKEEAAKAKAEKTADAKKVEAAYDAFVKAQNEYYTQRNAFIKKYGSFHMTYSMANPIFGLLDLLDI